MVQFSVIVPVYNKVNYIEKAIASVMSQSYRNFQLIVIDDGSTDGSVQKVLSILDQYPQSPFDFIQQQNQGVSMARNNAAMIAKGKYISFLDADDWWETDYLNQMNQLIDSYPEAGIFACNYYFVKNGKKAVHLNIPTGYINYFKEYAKTLTQPIWTGAVVIPREEFDSSKGFKKELKLGEDFDLWVRLAMHTKVAFLNKPLSNYNQDVDPQFRGITKLHAPSTHMLWNLQDFKELENSNPDFKDLIDKLRIYGLMRYYITKDYHQVAKEEIKKVDWYNQNKTLKREYNMPLIYLQLKYSFLKFGSKVKQYIIRKIK